MSTLPNASDGFVSFYRRYTKTWLHALATAALTAFGTLAIIHRGFIALAVGAYVLPPIVLYFSQSTTEQVDTSTQPSKSDHDNIPTEWTQVDAPTETTLFDATVTDSAAYAVGVDGIVIVDSSDGWQTLLTDGPTAAAQTLRGVDSTADGGAVWTAGDGGVVARFDAKTGRHVDCSAPNGRTDTWEAIAVGGPAADERVLLANGSGELLAGHYHDGDLTWAEPHKPGGGSSLSGITLLDDSVGYACDTNDGVYETTDGGSTVDRIGTDGVDGTLTDVAATGRGRCFVTADDGIVHRYDNGTWTPVRLGDDTLAAVAFYDDYGVACGDGALYERAAGAVDWERSARAGTGPLLGVSVGPGRAIAVGTDGTVLERRASSTH